jgi:trimeric autotransporter adhesin
VLEGGVNSIDNTKIKAQTLKVRATKNIDLDTEVERIHATSTQGNIRLQEANEIALLDASAKQGDITVTTQADLGLGKVIAKKLSLRTLFGKMFDAQGQDDANPHINLIAQDVEINAEQGFGEKHNRIEMDVSNLSAQVMFGGLYAQQYSLNPLNLVAGKNGDALNVTKGNIELLTRGDLNIQNAIVQKGAGSISLSSEGSIAQNSDIMTLGKGNINVSSLADIKMLPNTNLSTGVKTQTQGGIISYDAAQKIELTSLISKGFGGLINLSANQIVDRLEGGNLAATILNVNSPTLTDQVLTQLMGDKIAEAALLRLNYQVIGGSLANSRKLMSDLFLPMFEQISLDDESSEPLVDQTQLNSAVKIEELVSLN